MHWNPEEHTDDENMQWCWLRSVEWGRWPIFLSQPMAPLFLIFLSWNEVVTAVLLLNVLWALFIRYRVVVVPLAYWGVVVVMLKWITWPSATIWLFVSGRKPEAWVSLLWPLLIFPIGMITPTQIGRIQKMFMQCLGYEPKDTTIPAAKS
jgi:hypothetical protein